MQCSKCNETIDMAQPNIVGFTSIEYVCLKCSGTVITLDNLVNENTRLKKEIEFLRMAFDYYEPYEDE